MELSQRKNQRLKGFDYSNDGAYFITICTDNHKCSLSKIICDGRDNPCGCPQVKLTLLGKICEDTIATISKKYSVYIDEYVIMPNHIHFIIFIDNSTFRTTARVVPTVGRVVGAYKSLVYHEYFKLCKENNFEIVKLWQRSYYDHIIRDDEDLFLRIRYIEENPLRWCLKQTNQSF